MNMDIQAIWKKADSLRGCLSHLKTTNGRRKFTEDEDPLTIDLFSSDKAKLWTCKSRRTMAHKTQVFTLPDNALTRTRLIHVDEVVACSLVVAEMLGLNTSLTEAAAIGHDMGHVPYGHQGEHWMARQMGKPQFCHEIMGPIIAQKIERCGNGLNLTFETLEGMMCHSGSKAHNGMTPEAWALRYADKFAYIFADFNDIAIRAKYPIRKEIHDIFHLFGSTQRERTTTVISGLVIESYEAGKVSFEHSDLAKEFKKLRDLMYEVYPHVTQQDVGEILGPVYEFLDSLNIGDPWLLLALMNDKDVALVSGKKMKDISLFNQTALSEIAPHLEKIGPIDLCDPCLDW